MLKELLPKYLEFNSDPKFFGTVHGSIQKDYQFRWAHWVRKMIQLGILEEYLDIIPKDSTQGKFFLEIKTYTRIFEFLIFKKQVDHF